MGMAGLPGFLGLFVAMSSQAATYYVRNDGNDRANGTSDATAWATLDKVNRHSFKTGDVVLLREGGRWQGKLAVDWSGTASGYATVGAYYVENETAKKGLRGQRPIIEGAGRHPTGGIYDALVVVNAHDHVRIENLELKDSEGRGIGFIRSAHGDVVNAVVDGTYGSGIHFLDSDHGSVSRSFVTRAGLVFGRDGKRPWGAAITFVDSDSGRIADTTVSETYGEGINVNHGSRGTLIENNRVFAARAVGIYADAAPSTTIRRNIVVGTANREFWRTRDSVGAGIAINDEKYHYKSGGGSLPDSVQSKDVKIEGNVVVYTSSGIALWSQAPQAAHDNLIVSSNTLIDNGRQISGLENAAPGGVLADNVLLSVSAGTDDVDSSKLAGMTARNNHFSRGDPGGEPRQDGNRYDGSALSKKTDWRKIDSIDDVDWDELARMARASPNRSANESQP
jgi:hypothetical protein